MNPAIVSWISTLAGVPSSERAALIEAALQSETGRMWRANAGVWFTSLTPVESLVPETARKWRPLVADALQFVFSRLSDARLAAKISEQIELPPGTPPERRLLRLISKMPGLQKIGQVLARNRRISPALRDALIELENGMSDVDFPEVRAVLEEQLGKRLDHFGVKLEQSILSEASVSAVVRFTWRNPNRERERAVFKVLKPYVPHCFA